MPKVIPEEIKQEEEKTLKRVKQGMLEPLSVEPTEAQQKTVSPHSLGNTSDMDGEFKITTGGQSLENSINDDKAKFKAALNEIK